MSKESHVPRSCNKTVYHGPNAMRDASKTWSVGIKPNQQVTRIKAGKAQETNDPAVPATALGIKIPSRADN